jgi:4-hydroxy-4-methyl-2-oxoglutarate aldolase
MHPDLRRRVDALTTPHLADGSLRLGIEPRVLPSSLRPAWRGARLSGRALPVQHVGSVDVYLEAFGRAEPGDVLVVDDGGRTDRACVGDLVALEAQATGLDGILIWGLHRDVTEIVEIGLPVLSLGTSPWGPLAVERRPADAFDAARVGSERITREDAVIADRNGAIVLPFADLEAVVEAAEAIRTTEMRQAERIRSGTTLRDQVRFEEFLVARSADASLDFREHLRRVGGEIEV